MKTDCVLYRFLSACLLALLLLSSVVAQSKNGARNSAERSALSINQQDALELLKTLARELKSEPDRLGAATPQSQIADVLWQFDESFARDVFRWSFDAVSQPPARELGEADRIAYTARQASSIRQVLTRLGTHDRAQAEALLKSLQDDRQTVSTSSRSSAMNSQLLLLVALELSATNPEQALQLGLLSLSGGQVSPELGRLLFAIGNTNKTLADRLFRAALMTLRRNEFVYDVVLISLVNYLFSPNGSLHPDAVAADAQLLANYFVDAAWRQARTNEARSLPDESAMFYSLVQVRGLPIVSKFAPERLPELQGQLRELASGLTAAQMQSTTLLQATQQQQNTISNRNSYDIDEQIERASKEKDPDVRDSLLNSVAHSLMREDCERALKVAAMIDAAEVRHEAENDIYLAFVQKLLSAGSYDEARKITRKLDRPELKAKVLVEIAKKVLSSSDTVLGLALLTESSEVISKAEATPDKVVVLLSIAQQLGRVETIRGFETLASAIRTVNQLRTEEQPARSVLTKSRPLRIKTYTVLNGDEFSTSDRATLESIDFSQITLFATQDYLQTRLLANKLEQPLWRARYLTAVGSAMLATQSRSNSKLTSANGTASP